MAAVGGYQQIAAGAAAVGKPHRHAVGVFFTAGDAFAELHALPSPEIQHFPLQLCAGYRAGAAAGAFDQRREAELGHVLAAAEIAIRHAAQRSAEGFHDIAHAEVGHAFHAVGPYGNRRADRFDLFHRLIDVAVDPRLFERHCRT